MATLSEKQLGLLRGKNFGVVATVGPDGAPQTSVVWLDTDGEPLIFNTTNARAKGRNLRRDPRVNVTVWDNENPYLYFEVAGKAELDTEGANEHINELSRKYQGNDFHTPADRVIVRVKPERVSGYLE